MAAKQVDSLLQAVRLRDGTAITPQVAVVALGGAVVQDQEIPHALVFGPQNFVVAIDFGVSEIPIGEQRQEHGNGALDEVNAGGFQRFEKTGRQTDRNAILVPEALAPTGGELKLER